MAKPILLLNCGSSSIKYQVIDAETEQVAASGLIQRIGEAGSTIDHEVGEAEHHIEEPFADHAAALRELVSLFAEVGPDLSQVAAVGHRCVHGGTRFSKTTLIDESVVDAMRELSPLAPLHNPPGIQGIEAARAVLPDVPHVAIFDTAFFTTLPAEAYTYALPTELAAAHHIRKYGFHGTSHSYVSKKVAEFLGQPYDSLNQIVLHLGNGASVSAIQQGKAVETSMGLTPLAGLIMGTRSGDVDPGLHAYLGRVLGLGLDEIDALLNRQSGMLGLAGATDFRDINAKIQAGDKRAALAMDVYIHRLLTYVGAYIAVLGQVDALTFTAGVGENDFRVRAHLIKRLAPLGFELDEAVNEVRSKEPRVISTANSRVTVLVVPTNEELAMARETLAAISQ
ncbi:MAG: acetate kinase [Propionibacteriaceae bacterium]|jgi:acetate kinase|nr:acetate kinase [Propionibacteriaceae bacterium]